MTDNVEVSAPEPTAALGAPVYFSIIMPTFNRAATVKRAIASCLSQAFDGFEVLVIDDASTDSTIASAEEFADPRVRILRHSVNLGPCAARNTGASAARGRWLVMLDSDDELAHEALDRLAALTAAAPTDVGNVATRCLWDDGGISPETQPPTASLDYPAFLEWADGLAADKVEWFNCVRHEVFERVQYPAGRANEGGFHLDLASNWRFQISSEVCAHHHTDVEGVTRPRPGTALADLRAGAKDTLRETERILSVHGAALRRYAPRRYRDYVRAASFYHFLMGQRRAGFRLAVEAIRREPGDPRTWGTLVLGLLSGELLGRVKASRTARVQTGYRP